MRQTKEAIEVLKSINPAILVEGEIGDIGTGSEIHDTAPDLAKGLTTPAEAKRYVEATGVDILAPSRGQHARHAQEHDRKANEEAFGHPERSAQIKSAAQVPLTLHGGSGTDDGIFGEQSPPGSISSTSTQSCGSHGDVALRRA